MRISFVSHSFVLFNYHLLSYSSLSITNTLEGLSFENPTFEILQCDLMHPKLMFSFGHTVKIKFRSMN